MSVREKHRLISFGLSFMDCICCGFGAVILLFVLSKGAHPQILEQREESMEARLIALQQQQETLEQQARAAQMELKASQKEIEQAQDDIARSLRQKDQNQDTQAQAEAAKKEMAKKLARARQELSQVQRSLQAKDFKPGIAGIPVDSEYVAFVIDSSNSMAKFQWQMVLQKFEETINAYPDLKGMQILSENGIYMIEDTRGEWIPDSRSIRRSLRLALDNFAGRSHELQFYSNPVPGIERAMRELYQPGINMCIYVFGDELQKDTIGVEEAIQRIDRINTKPDGSVKVRIHALGFPLVVSGAHERTALYRQVRHWPRTSGEDFATLMRELCQRSQGTFVGLPRYRE